MNHNYIIKEVAKVYNKASKDYPVTIDDIYGRSRKKYIVEARQVCIYFMYKITKLSQPKIMVLIKKDHSTISHSIRVIQNRHETKQLLINNFNILYYKFTNPKYIKVIRKQQEVLYVGKKLVSVEAGQIVNSGDFTFNELDSIGNFLKNSIINLTE